ncbi:hypothetical protein ZIOFF_001489 [Zingiber officinale]|uniref:DUF4057 domain-containing protein n=1 Tax=Zingiber officinale TaxID=94328 RepID=A0A8J5LV22_ZINOF|nr:hypothetical protein ZIOFF_001489 [Zingiber officinale]
MDVAGEEATRPLVVVGNAEEGDVVAEEVDRGDCVMDDGLGEGHEELVLDDAGNVHVVAAAGWVCDKEAPVIPPSSARPFDDDDYQPYNSYSSYFVDSRRLLRGDDRGRILYSTVAVQRPLVCLCCHIKERERGAKSRTLIEMDQNLSARMSGNYMADLLPWPNEPAKERLPTLLLLELQDFFSSFSTLKSTDRISPTMFGMPMTKEEAKIVNKRKSLVLKLQDMNGNGIFDTDDDAHDASY